MSSIGPSSSDSDSGGDTKVSESSESCNEISSSFFLQRLGEEFRDGWKLKMRPLRFLLFSNFSAMLEGVVNNCALCFLRRFLDGAAIGTGDISSHQGVLMV